MVFNRINDIFCLNLASTSINSYSNIEDISLLPNKPLLAISSFIPLLLYDYKLILTDQNNELHVIELSFPILKFLLHLQVEDYEECYFLAEQIEKEYFYLIAELFWTVNQRRAALKFMDAKFLLKVIDDNSIDWEDEEFLASIMVI